MTGAAIYGCAGTELSAEERAFFRDADPWGFIVFDRNLENASQIRALCDALRDGVGRDAPILIDQEGGRVQRLRPPLARDWLPPLDQVARAGENAARSMYLRYRLIADELRALGIDANCAPMADIADDTTHPFLKNRCYGTNVDDVVAVARAVADGCLDGGVLPILKHIPGHGRAVADSHHDLPRLSDPAEALFERDFEAFRRLNDIPLGMTAHIVYEAFDDRPATTSPEVMRIVRGEIGFDGLVMTDDISMKALSDPMADRCQDSLAAGCDLILHCNGDMAEMRVVAEASGRLSKAALARSEAALACRKSPEPIDIEAAEAELSRLLGGEVHG
ncbi:beta-N-acetylhexosaminidase [Anianabacter salinae]|uniref:beta-N-acetylhexosaminidase n=1 Tax=Anianabacter salinae TaxID=2851023 RepID=UPI00225DE39F|nr:beta-N-acetylhexosaminidase [Anianabacter salinae]MBV0911897.1 beta-N-acetylhexosaminidase [Anianabacter salinae]